MSRQADFAVCQKCRAFVLATMPYLDFCESCYFNIVDEYTKWKDEKDHAKKTDRMRTLRG